MGALLSLALHFHSSWEFFMNKLLLVLCNKHVFESFLSQFDDKFKA